MHDSRSALIRQLQAWNIQQPALLDVISTIDRKRFLPDEKHFLADKDVFIKLECGYSMAPIHFTAKHLNAIDLSSINDVLCVGSGCGFELTLLAMLGVNVMVAEPNTKLHQSLQNILSPNVLKHIQWTDIDAHKMPIEDKLFDLIWYQGAINSIPQHHSLHAQPTAKLLAMLGKTKDLHQAAVVSITNDHIMTLFDASFPHYPHLDQKDVFTF